MTQVINGENPEVITKEPCLGVIIESLIKGSKSFLTVEEAERRTSCGNANC